MRNLFFGLSVIFFALSGIILFKALSIPIYHSQQQNYTDGLNKKDTAAEAYEASVNHPKDQASNQAAVLDSQAASASSGEEEQNKSIGTQASDETSVPGNKARVLAMIGDGAFNSGQIVIDDSLMNTIKEVVPDILSSPDYRVYVEGHTDDMPIKSSYDKRYVDNMELSFLRAKAVASVLVDNGVPKDRISVTGYGEARPIASNETVEGRIKNRRVEIKLVPEDKEM